MKLFYMFPIVLVLVACGQPSVPTKSVSSSSAPIPIAPVVVAQGHDAKLVARGGEIFRANCASCHGANAEGAPNWSQKGPDGKFPAPPLNGTGHAWHHPKAALVQTIMEGTVRLGGSMPAWKDKLSSEDIDAAVAWFQSHWPEELYRNWLVMDHRAQR